MEFSIAPRSLFVSVALGCLVAASERRRSEAATKHPSATRSEEHTSELQSLAYLVCRLLLEKKKAFTVMQCGQVDRLPARRDALVHDICLVLPTDAAGEGVLYILLDREIRELICDQELLEVRFL